MFLGGITSEIHILDEKEFYTNGDLLRGYVLVTSGKSFDVRNIEVKLRCDENAHVWIPSDQGGYHESERLRHVSNKSVIFPSPSVLDQSGSDAQHYTINKGTHKFDFELRIPMSTKYPQSITIEGSASCVRWYLKATVHMSSVLSSVLSNNKRTYYEFEMRPRMPIFYNGTELRTESAKVTFNAVLPQLESQTNNPTARRFKGFFPANSQLSTPVETMVILGAPVDGVLQAPSTLPLQIDIKSSNNDLLLITRFELKLKTKYVVSVNHRKNCSVHRETLTIIDIRLEQPFKRAVDTIQDLIFASQLARLPGTFRNKHFDISYKFVATVHLAGIANPNSSEKIRVTIPTILHHTAVGPTDSVQDALYMEEEFDEPPMYHELPLYGEKTFET